MACEDIYTLNDLEIVAKQQIPLDLFDWIQGGAQHEETIDENKKALLKYKIKPRMMRNVANRSLKTTILGHEISMPICAAPSSSHIIIHSDGEIATAKGIQASDVAMTISLFATVSTEDIMNAVPSMLSFQQLHITNPKSGTLNIVRAAEQNGVKGIVVTVDQPVLANKLRGKRNKFDLKSRVKLGNPAWKEFIKQGHVMFNPSQTWEDISWLKSVTKLPVITKGILSAEDAMEAINHGADAIWVSNHGGRQLDCVQGTMDVLPEIVKAVGGRSEVYIDGGFRTGLDVFKALALGARAVFVGRPVLYGLSCGGADGIKNMFDVLRTELDNTMALSGCSKVTEINHSYVTTTCSCK